MNKTIELIAAAIVISSISCTQAPYDEGLDVEGLQRDNHMTPQGNQLQGISWNGLSPQGLSPQGDQLKGFVFASFQNENGPVAGVYLDGTVFHGTDGQTSAHLEGDDFIGATLTAVRGDNTPTPIRIDDVQVSSDPEITLYQLAWYDGTTWVNPCGEMNGSPILAVPVKGRWIYSSGTSNGGDYVDDPNMFTFSCSTAVIGKCVFFGYKPWKTIQECDGTNCQTLSLQPFHQACTRMMRGDYCGNGNGHTVNGTVINLFDNFSIQLDESTTLTLEAEWSPEGAKCVKHLRWGAGGQQVIDDAQSDIDANCSGIDDTSVQATCGSTSSTFNTNAGYSTALSERALLRNESTPPP